MGYIKSVFCSIATIPVFYITAVLFGAPLLSNFDDTFVFSAALAFFASFPLFYSTNGDFDQLCDIVFDYNFSTKSQYFAHRCAIGSLAGAWLGAIVIPLDWDRWWQKWPIPCLFGIFIGALLSLLVAQIQLYFDYLMMEADDLFLDLFNPKTPKLEAIIFAEFDNNIGRVIKYQIPHDIFDKQKFDTFSSAIIPSKEMQNRMIKINMYNYKIMGHPIGLTNSKYAREVYIFNMCFIVPQESQNDSIYEPIVQKLASYLVDLENESEVLSSTKQSEVLPPLMEKIFNDLNEKGECINVVSPQTTIYLKLCPSFHGREPPVVNSFMVPIFTRVPPPISNEALNKMDVLSQKICPKIDGVRCIKDISQAVKIDADLVGRCIQNLYFYGCISLLPMFLYSNIYTLDYSKKIRLFLENDSMKQECVKFIALKHETPPLINDVCRLYLSLKNGMKLKDWCLRMQPRQFNVDERKLIQFGIFYGFVRKLSIYPVAINQEEGIKIMKMCNGERSLEDLALEYSCSPIELHQNLVENGNFSFIVR